MEIESNYVKHAKREFEALGWPGDCGMQSIICDNVIELLEVFGNQGHSGSSFGYVLNLFQKLASFKPISPLTGEDSEWNDVGCVDTSVWQNKRASHVFKDSKTGQAYDINGKIFRDPTGSCWINSESRVYITFPYTPTTEYVDRDED